MADYIAPLQRSNTLIGDLQQRFSNLGIHRGAPVNAVRDNRDPSGLSIVVPTQDAFVELIFVHGLRGHQKLSWTYDADDAATFWPSWLTDETGFSRVRIHSFGYNVDSTDRRVLVSKLNDFGTLLCETLAVNSHLKRDLHNPIIFIAHSLGGLVVKAAINYAKRNPDFGDLTRRFHTVIFLATPHRGADNLTMLNNIIRATTPPSQSVGGPDPSATVIENINQDFRQHRHGIRFWSFYESLPTFHNSNDLIVDKASAVLDFPEEHRLMLAANHFSASKYSSTSDPCYIVVRDTLKETIDNIEEELRNPEKINDQLRSIAEHFDIPQTEQEDFFNRVREKVEGTCQWLTQQEDFRNWQEAVPATGTSYGITNSTSGYLDRQSRRSANQASNVFWLIGPPGSGKSFLAAHVVAELQENRECSYYFLKHAEQSKQNLATLLKSIALQMARRHRVLRHWLMSLAQDDMLTTEYSDFRTVWKQLFVQKIFQLDLLQRQYWVIDAIDEGRGSHDLIAILAQIPKHLPYSIFLTSRKSPRLEQTMHLQKVSPVIHTIAIQDSLGDIRTYLEAHQNLLPVSEIADLQSLISQLVRKSRGSFLWISLVLRKLSDSWTKRDREKILRSVPDGMHELYLRILEDMTSTKQLDLPKAILRWTVCSIVPLTIGQFQEAVQLDIRDEVTRIEEAITRTCGQLVVIDHRQVHLVHNTVREFLFDPQLKNDLAMSKSETHKRIATICLEHLTSGSRNTRLRNPHRGRNTANTGQGTFVDYASKYFSEHVVKSIPNRTDSPLSELLQFLQTSSLNWIEYCARQNDLSRLMSAGKNLKSYIQQMTDFQPSLSEDTAIVQEWSTDLIHLVTAFGRVLVDEPAAIHSVIPALCPKKSRIFRAFGSTARGLEVIGRSGRIWSDLLSSTPFAPDYCQALACSERLFAVGTRSGLLVVFSSLTCQEEWRIDVKEPIKKLDFARSTLHSWLAVSTKDKIIVLDYDSKSPVCEVRMQSEALALCFSLMTEEVESLRIMALTKDGCFEIYDPFVGRCEDREPLYGHVGTVPRRRRPPTKAYISDELRSFALVWRNEPLEIYSIDDISRVRYVEFTSSVEALAFNSAMSMIATATFDGQLSITGLWNLQQIKSVNLSASHLATTTDGQTLVAGANSGTIKILDFESLALLHTIVFSELEIMSLMFAGSGLRFLDIRRQFANVWESSALIRRKDADKSLSSSASDLQTYSTAPSELIQSYLAPMAKTLITTMVADGSGRFIFCGKQDGQVTVYDAFRTRNRMPPLFNHGRSAIACLDWNDNDKLITSCDNANRVMVHQVRLISESSLSGPRDRWSTRKILDQRLETPEPVRRVICGTPPQYLLIATTRSDFLWKLDGTHITNQTVSGPGYHETRWVAHPTQKRRLIGLQNETMHSIKWTSTSGETPAFETVLPDSLGTKKLQVIAASFSVAVFEGGTCVAHDNDPYKAPLVWTMSSNTGHCAEVLERLRVVAPIIKSVGGIFGSQLVFLGTDGWFQTLRLDENSSDRDVPVRRFPLPHCWQTNNRVQQPLFLVTKNGDVIVTTGDELVVVQRGLTSGGL